MRNTKILSIDLQKDFTDERGKYFKKHTNVLFIKEVLVPFCRENNLTISEIISDYRHMPPGENGNSCVPGTFGYESEIPEDIKLRPDWVKCNNAPLWTQDNIGVPDTEPGVSFEDPHGFEGWLFKGIGKPEEVNVVLIGLTLDCCVLCAAQELSMRGYKVSILEEGVDPHSANQEEKTQILNSHLLENWASVVKWETLKQLLTAD